MNFQKFLGFGFAFGNALVGFCLGWESPEHKSIGTLGFEKACLAASEDSTINREVFSSFCGNVETRSRLYGEAAWISGDYINNSRALSGDKLEALKVMESTWNYANLANENDLHFHPSVKQEWLKQIEAALEIAEQYGKTGNAARNLRIVDLVFYQNAYADHFLQDAFATGHFGFNRRLTSSSPSRNYHDFWSSRGRFIRNGEKTWYGFGDGCLDYHHKKCAVDSTLQSGNMEFIIYVNSLSILACMHHMSGNPAVSSAEIHRIHSLLPSEFFVDERFEKDFIPKGGLNGTQFDTDSGSWIPAEGVPKSKQPAYSLHLYASGFTNGEYFDAAMLPYLRAFGSIYGGVGIGYQFYSAQQDSVLTRHFIMMASIMYLPNMKMLSSKVGFSLNAQNIFYYESPSHEEDVFASANAFINLELGWVNPMLGVFIGRKFYEDEPEYSVGAKIGIALNWSHFTFYVKDGEGHIEGLR